MAGIDLHQLTKVYANGVRAVDAIDLEIRDGEFMVLVGPSGCGKSTLLRMIAGLEEVSGGTVRIDERDVTALAPRARDIAMVFQDYALYPHMTVRQNLGFGLKLRRVNRREIEQRVQAVATTLGLQEYLARRPAALSGGQRQRVAIGRAMVREPKAFLMDEPLSNLDAKLRVTMRAELARLHERLAVTTVYVTHDQTEAMTLGQRVAVIRDGTVQQCDTPQELFDRPNNLFVAAFIGSPAMNLVTATVEDATIRFADIVLPLAEGAAVRGQRRDVILGIRPTDFELADRAADPALPRIRVAPEVIEGLGAETNLIFPLAAPRVDSDTVRSAAEGGDVGTLLADDDRALFTARIATRTPIAQDGPIELVVHNASLHFFDPETGAALR
ncbi:MAG TPA: sn-glycerol-3-phosphate ABC transporter ATP-binding protein UgpC [Gaiellales bacterium]